MRIGAIGCAERFRSPGLPSRLDKPGDAHLRPMPTGISNNKDLDIEKIAITLQLAPTPMPGINTAQ
ncbi:hypothetical protein JL101_027340 [Skermanella rosea]|uniref:Uncharacterized protein n=1 Tax=Skermanella cutis TaxID=2775420 RepID=A0ABX7BAL2_9PROT|nr:MULTISPECIES: hypothetical protein [Skermanella]QQP89477.1 hypothetical protein IGS68_26490 [Skermanella sp. TT6]UEM03623.1 hypothetical protein JL101_027340 [Skermanella rosea]